MSVLPRSRTGSSRVEAYQRKRTDVATVPLEYKLRQQTAGLKHPRLEAFRTSRVAGRSSVGDILAAVPQEPPGLNANPQLLDEIQGNRKAQVMPSDINSRRERLRLVISSEEAQFAREILARPQTVAIRARAEEVARRDEQLRLREEEEQRHLVILKRRQQFYENSHEARDRISREIARKVKLANLTQILEKNFRIKEEKKLDQLWYEVMAKEGEALKRREEDEAMKRKMKEKETGLVLSRQMAEKSISGEELKRRRAEEREELEKLWQEVREEEMRALEVERLKREKLRGGLEEQLVEARREFEEKMKQEAAVAQKLKFISEAEASEEERRLREAKIRLQREIDGYMKHLEELKADQARREQEVDAIIENSARDIEARRDLARKQYKERQARLRDEIIKARDEQLKTKRDVEAEERKKLDEEREILRKNAQIAQAESLEDVNKRKENAVRYRRELQAQLEQQESDKRRGIAEDCEQEAKVLKEQEEFQKFKEELANQPDEIPVKAFRVKMRECDATRRFF